LAAELAVSRNTVLTAFEQLAAEGYVEGRAGRGTSVAQFLPDEAMGPKQSQRRPSTHRAARQPSRRGAFIAGVRVRPLSSFQSRKVPFRRGCALADFPVEQWGRLARRQWSRPPTDMLDYGGIAGFLPLRNEIAAYLRRARGVICDADQVIIVNGSQQGLNLAARILADPGDAAWIEDPGYDGSRAALQAAGVRTIPVRVDADGLNVADGIRRAAHARLACVTPSHQFPLGATMTLRRRLELLQWARKSGAWVVEDDYDSDVRFSSRPLPALQGLDTAGCVIYLGTFSKILFPSIRLGYLVVPNTLVDAFLKARLIWDVHLPTINQAILADFMAQGFFERHVRRMRTLYRERQEALLSAAQRFLRGLLNVEPADCGMHVVGWLQERIDDRAAAEAARRAGVEVSPLSMFAESEKRPGGLLLGYAAFTPESIAKATGRLAEALEPLCQGAHSRRRHHD
jgi:GntR family transcriptional regulator/MocR family aminotransferase